MPAREHVGKQIMDLDHILQDCSIFHFHLFYRCSPLVEHVIYDLLDFGLQKVTSASRPSNAFCIDGSARKNIASYQLTRPTSVCQIVEQMMFRIERFQKTLIAKQVYFIYVLVFICIIAVLISVFVFNFIFTMFYRLKYLLGSICH